MQLEGKVALITGAGSGIGKAAALLLAKEVATVAALGRTAGEVEQTVAGIERAGGQGLVLVADIAQPDAMQCAIQQIADRTCANPCGVSAGIATPGRRRTGLG